MKTGCLAVSNSLMDSIERIESSSSRLAVVLSESNTVLGTVTDGDVRRHLLGGGSLQDDVVDAMNSSPIVGRNTDSKSVLLGLLRENNIRSLPLIDQNKKFLRIVCDLELSDANVDDGALPSFPVAVIMAGGKGRRLGDITKNLPKPMVKIQGVPLLERLVLDLAKGGVDQIFISINYLGHLIKDYFGDGSKYGISIQYLEENIELGTGGALSLLPNFTDQTPILVMNGDILTTLQYSALLETHISHEASITIGAVNYESQVPYGVITHSSGLVSEIIEKPTHVHLCNAGIYAISSEVLKFIPRGQFFNITDLIQNCLGSGRRVGVFPLHEYWSDIGTPDDLEVARENYSG